jgi:hypothetical protein
LQDAARRTNELETAVTRESVRCHTLDADLELATEALRVAEQRRLAEAAGFADRLAQYHAEVAANAAQITRQRDAAEQRLTEAILALEQARVDRAADAVTAADHLATREAEQLSELRDTAIARDRLQQRLIDADTALRCASNGCSRATRRPQRIAEHQAEFQAELSRQSGIRDLLRSSLLAGRCQQAEDRRADELRRRRLARSNGATVDYRQPPRRGTRFKAAWSSGHREATDITRRRWLKRGAIGDEQTATRRACRGGAAQELRAALHRSSGASHATERHAAEMGDATARLADEQIGAHARVSEAAAAHDARAALHRSKRRFAMRLSVMLWRWLRLSRGPSRVGKRPMPGRRRRQRPSWWSRASWPSPRLSVNAQEVHAAALGDAADRLAEHEQATATWLSEAAVFANALETGLADTVRTLRQVEEQAAVTGRPRSSDPAAAVFDGQLAEAEARYQELIGQLQIAEAARQADRERHSLEMSEAAAHLAENQRKADSRLAQADTAIKVAESKRAESLAALDRVVRQASAERQAASIDARQRQMNFDGSLREEIGRRQAIEKDLYAARIGAEEARLQFVNELAAATERGLEAEARLLAQAAEERAAWEAVRLRAEEIEHLKEGDRLHQSS